MTGQRIFIWEGGQPHIVEGCQEWAEMIPPLPEPAPLGRTAHISYRWGEMAFNILATACSLRTTVWGDGSMTWLHCKAKPIAEITPDESTGMMTALIPASYVTSIQPGPTFRLNRSRPSVDLGVFPPVWPAPAGSLPLAEVERILEELLTPERN
jgi:hypothetical protein